MEISYNKDSIISLPFRDAVRQKIAMYLGSADMKGAYHAIQEIISNCIDEYIMGYGSSIEIHLLKDGGIMILDEGRGVPFGQKEDGSNTLEIVYSKAHTGGKFDDKVYARVVGLNGIGAKATCLSSEYFEVQSKRDGKIASAKFEKGVMVGYSETDSKSKDTGTSVKFKPDAEVFKLEPVKIEFDKIYDLCKGLTYLTQGLTFKLIDDTTGRAEILCSANGLIDLIRDKATSPIHPIPITYSVEENGNRVEIALQWTKGRERFFCFTNGAENPEGGTPITGLKTSITRNLNKHFKGQLTGDLARTGLIYAVNCSVKDPSFANQTKNKVNNNELRSLADRAFSEAWSQFTNLNPEAVKKIEDFLIKEKKAEEAAEKARQKVYNSNKAAEEGHKAKVLCGEKFKDCRDHGINSSIYICEGDSAATAFETTRDSKYVAVLPIRGKIINALKNPIEDILDNQEVKDIIKILGCGIDDKCNVNKLRYGKVVFAADADPDGYSIVCLLLALFYKLMPELIIQGKVCWIQMPLYEVIVGKKVYFAYDDEELSKLPKGEINRNKGLGEMGAESFERAAFGEEARLIQFTITDAAAASKMMDVLLGTDNISRKDYIFDNIDFSKVEE